MQPTSVSASTDAISAEQSVRIEGNRSSVSTCHLLQYQGVVVGFLSHQKYVLMHTLAVRPYEKSFSQISNGTGESTLHTDMQSLLAETSVFCLSVCLFIFICCFQGCEIFLLWTAWALAEGQLYLALDLVLSVWDKRIERAEDMSGYGFHSQLDTAVLCGQRLTSGRCLFMRAVNTGSGRL